MNLWDFDAIDWDDADDELGNLVHCQLHGVDERVVDQVLRGEPAEVNLKVQTAEWVILGPALEAPCGSFGLIDRSSGVTGLGRSLGAERNPMK